MTTKFLTLILSVITYGTVWAQTPYTKSTVKNSIHTSQIQAGFHPNLRNSVETKKHMQDTLRHNARSESELDHLGAYNFSTVFPRKNIGIRQRKSLYRD